MIQKPVQLDIPTHDRLNKIASSHQRTMKQFVIDMLTYFETTGIEPADAANTSIQKAVQSLNRETLKIAQMQGQLDTLQETLEQEFTTLKEKQANYSQATKRAFTVLLEEIKKEINHE